MMSTKARKQPDRSPCKQNLVKSDDDMVIDVLRLDDYFNKLNKKKTSKKFLCYYWRYGQVCSNLTRNKKGGKIQVC